MRTLAALAAGLIIGSSATALAAPTINYPLQTWLGVKDIQDKIGNPYVGSPGTLAGQIAQVRGELFGVENKLTVLCQLHQSRC